MKNKILLTIAAIAISAISILGTLQYQKTQTPQGPEAAKTALRITNILKPQFKTVQNAESYLNPGYALYQITMDEPVSTQDTYNRFKEEHEAIIAYNIEMEKLKELFQPLMLEAKYDPTVKHILKQYKKEWEEARMGQVGRHNEFFQNKNKLINRYKSIQKEMKLKPTDPHYIRLQKSINTWESYYAAD